MVPETGGIQVELQPPARSRPAARYEDDRRSGSAHGAENPSWGYNFTGCAKLIVGPSEESSDGVQDRLPVLIDHCINGPSSITVGHFWLCGQVRSSGSPAPREPLSMRPSLERT
jgi:hypothetical protein